MKFRLLFCCALLMLSGVGCTSDKIAGRFEADIKVDPTTHQLTGLHVLTTKNYGDIKASGTIDPKTNMPIFSISATKVDATSLAAIVAQSNASIAKSVSSGIVKGIGATMIPGAP